MAKISERAWRQRAFADRLWAEKAEAEAAARPDAPLAAKMYPRKSGLLPDHKRGAVSPLGGVARSKQ
jgi:hypothetical protein